jgi:predicted oxidoreductase (fatty acid repression mutant protein)
METQVLFFDDRETIQEMQNTYAIYHDKFPIWAAESTAMHQFAVWTALELEGFGANLQHYDPLIDEKVASTWKLPETWKLKATLVFGTPTGPAGDKSFKPVEDRFKVFGA